MNFPQTVDQLIHWDVSSGRDWYGSVYVITGYEGTECCFWCGANLNGQRRRFCGKRSGHWTLYTNHFYWSNARSWCLERYEYTCANCGYHTVVPRGDHPSWYTHSLEAHHIIPLEGYTRAWSVYNVPWNLICLCHDCHQLIHAVMREVSRPVPPDIFDLALARGQAVFEALR